jgi:predicted phage gp36 major capsid-like protein
MADAHLLLSAEDGGLEINLQIEAQIVAGDGTARPSGPAACSASHATAHTAAEEGIEDVAEVDLLPESTRSAEGRSWSTLRCGTGSDALFACELRKD